jgi:hypothetical protein
MREGTDGDIIQEAVVPSALAALIEEAADEEPEGLDLAPHSTTRQKAQNLT